MNDEDALHGLQRTGDKFAFGPDVNVPKPVVDFHAGERNFYGKIDHLGRFVTLRQRIDKSGSRMPAYLMSKLSDYIKFGTPTYTLRSIRSPTAGGRPLQSIYFIERAYREFVRCFREACRCERTFTQNPYLRDLKAYKAYEPIEVIHTKHQRKIYRGFTTYLWRVLGQNYNRKICFDKFISLFIEYYSLLAPNIPLTMSALMKSNIVSVYNSGLAISVADLNCGFDQKKIDLFIDDPAFELFMTCAVNNGFSIDKNVPWRLVADLNSPAMINYMQARGTAGIATFFNIAYDTAYKDDYNLLKRFLINSYNSFARAYPKYSTPVYQGSTIIGPKRRKRKPVNIAEIDETYDNSFWLRLYTEIRNMEEGGRYETVDLNNFYNDINNLSMTKDCEFIENQIDLKFRNLRAGNTLLKRIIKKRTEPLHLEEDKLPLFEKINQKDIAKRRKSDILTGRLQQYQRGGGPPSTTRPINPLDAKRRVAMRNNKYGQSRLKLINRHGSVDMAALARLYYKNTDHVGGVWLEGETWYSGAGDQPPGSNAGRQVFDFEAEASTPSESRLFDEIYSQTRGAYDGRGGMGSNSDPKETDSFENMQTDVVSSKTCRRRRRTRRTSSPTTTSTPRPTRGSTGGAGGGMGGGGY